MSRDCASPSTARISITVTEFREIGRREGWSRADVELIDTGNGKVSQGRINDPIVVSAAVYLEFFVSGGQGDRHAYVPVGISFREMPGAVSRDQSERESGARDPHLKTANVISRGESDSRCAEGDVRDPLGRSAFPVRTMVSKGDAMQLTLHDANPAPGEFKFDLIIQRSDGVLGIIDPAIQNQGVYM